MPVPRRQGFSDPGEHGPEAGGPAASSPEAQLAGGAPTHEAAIAALVGLRLADVEQALIEATLDRHGGSVATAASMLGLSPSTLYRKRAAWAGLPGGTRGTG